MLMIPNLELISDGGVAIYDDPLDGVWVYVVMNKPRARLTDHPEPPKRSIAARILISMSDFFGRINGPTDSSLYTDSGIVCTCIVCSNTSPSSVGFAT